MAIPWLGIGIGAQVGSSILGGFLGSQQKEHEESVFKYNAQVMRNRAKDIKKQTSFIQKRQAEKAARTQGLLEASLGGSGTVSTEGAPLLAQALQKSESELENFLIGQQGRSAMNEVLSKASEFDMRARAAKRGASNSLLSGFIGAGATGLMGYAMIPKTTTPSPDFGGIENEWLSIDAVGGF